MPKFSNRSLARLSTVHKDLQEIFYAVIKYFDCSILCGHRIEEAQNLAYDSGFSKFKWPESLHNMTPALAIDVAPYPINWEDYNRFYYFAGFVQGIASQQGIKLRYGGDWDRDTEVRDQNFYDLVHFELVITNIHKSNNVERII